MLTARLELEDEWDLRKNKKLGLDINKMTKGSNKKVWWICPKCDSSYDMSVRERVNGANCPYCAGRRVNHTNSLTVTNPSLASEWHPIKNENLTPDDVTKGKRQNVWWLCEYGHEWEARISSRSHGNRCPYCSNRLTLTNFNDMWTTNPELAALLLNPQEGYMYSKSSNKRLDWKCSNCKEAIKNKIIIDVNRHGLSCKKCGDGISYGEKIVYNILQQLGFIFEKEKTFSWLKNKRYDFYIPSLNTIIEVHGMQHFEETSRKGARTLIQEQENDRYKERLAKENGIECYVVIDARFSTISWIKNSLLDSSINSIIGLDRVNWIECNRYASKSLVIEICEHWNNNDQPSTAILSKKFKLSVNTIVNFLKQGTFNGWCNYDVNESRIKGMQLLGIKRRKVIYQLNMNEEIIREWDYINDVAHEFNITPSAISKACTSKSHKSCGFKWMYKEDYEEMIKVNNI